MTERKPHPCTECGGPITRRKNEHQGKWNSRQLCGRACNLKRQKRAMGGYIARDKR